MTGADWCRQNQNAVVTEYRKRGMRLTRETDADVAAMLREVAKEDGAVLTASVVKDFRLSIGLRRGGMVRISDGGPDPRVNETLNPVVPLNCMRAPMPLFDDCAPQPPTAAKATKTATAEEYFASLKPATLAPESRVPGCCDKSPGPEIPPKPKRIWIVRRSNGDKWRVAADHLVVEAQTLQFFHEGEDSPFEVVTPSIHATTEY